MIHLFSYTVQCSTTISNHNAGGGRLTGVVSGRQWVVLQFYAASKLAALAAAKASVGGGEG